MTIIIDVAGQVPEEADVFELIRDSWAKLGIRMFTKPSVLDVFHDRIFAGQSMMSAWTGLENGLATPDSLPDELAAVEQMDLEWPKWGQFHETDGKSGERPDMPKGKELLALLAEWRMADDSKDRAKIWGRMLAIHADQVFIIGTVYGAPQPVVVSNRLHNVPRHGIYSFEPGSFFGIYHPYLFWLDPPS